MSKSKTPIIFFNIGWMKNYQGQTKEDMVISNFGYVVENKTGHEQFNFLEKDGDVFGYVPLKWYKGNKPTKIGIERLGAGSKDAFIEGVTVVFISKNPYAKGTRVVGWYQNATVYREPKPLEDRLIQGHSQYYYARADKENCFCIPEDEREILIPTAEKNKEKVKKKGGYGQTPIWYASDRLDVQKMVLTYIDDIQKKERTLKVSEDDFFRIKLSQEDKKKIEIVAVDTVIKSYQGKGYEVVSTESENCGWDLVAMKGKKEVYIEVKGTAGKQLSFQLTHNEYTQLKENYEKYRIAFVKDCLRKPHLEIYRIERVKNNKKIVYKGVKITKKEEKIFYLTERVETTAFPTAIIK